MIADQASLGADHAVEGKPTPASVLEPLTQQRLLDLSRVFGIGVRDGRATKATVATKVAHLLDGQLPVILRELGRDELLG